VQKNYTVNWVLTDGFSCQCSRSNPLVAQYFIWESIQKYYSDVQYEYLYDEQGHALDIYLPSLPLGIEVKYGNDPFGVPTGRASEKKRYDHVMDQFRRYRELPYGVTYLVIAEEQNLKYIPKQLRKFKHYFLEDIHTFSIGKFTLPHEVIEKLKQLYRTPYKVRELLPLVRLDYLLVREKLCQYLRENEGFYPPQDKLQELFGHTATYVDRALGLGLNATCVCVCMCVCVCGCMGV